MKRLLSARAVQFAVIITVFLSQGAFAGPADYYDTVQKVYIGYYQRPADPEGLFYWADKLEKANGSLTEIIDAFANSAESVSLYGVINGTSISTVIDSIYTALFNRTADQGGKAYYTAAYTAGQFPDGRRCTEGTIVLDILGGAQNQDLLSMTNKLAAAKVFTGIVDPDSNGKDFQVTYAGDSDAVAARNFLASYATATRTATQAETSTYIQAYIANPGEKLAANPLKTSVIAKRLPGMSFSYKITGTLTDGEATYAITGMSTKQILSTPKKSPVTLDDCLDAYESVTLKINGRTVTNGGHSYFLQDADGSVRVYGHFIESSDAWVVSPGNGSYLEVISPVGIGQSHGYSANFSDGASLTNAYTVQAIEEVATEMGTFQAYRGTRSETYHYASGEIDRYVGTYTTWFVPGVGEVKSIMNVTYYSGGNIKGMMSATYVLYSTNVNY